MHAGCTGIVHGASAIADRIVIVLVSTAQSVQRLILSVIAADGENIYSTKYSGANAGQNVPMMHARPPRYLFASWIRRGF
jgi:hypothetical protein